MTTGADITALVAMLRHIQCEPASFDTYSMASAAERAADAIERLSLSATTAADISPEAVERMAQFLPIAHMQEELDKAAAMLRALRSALTDAQEIARRGDDIILGLEKTLDVARSSLTARDDLLRQVGIGGPFHLVAVSGDDADAWYEKRNELLGIKR